MGGGVLDEAVNDDGDGDDGDGEDGDGDGDGIDLLLVSWEVVYWTRPPPVGPYMLRLGRLSIG